jgi:hypothetical protein
MTQPGLPIPDLGCAGVGLAPVRVGRVAEALTFSIVDSGRSVEIAWPPGYYARERNARGELLNFVGAVVARETDVIGNLIGSSGDDGTFRVCMPIGYKLDVVPTGGDDQ